MGFVRVTNIQTGKVEIDSRREELSDKSNEYIDWLNDRLLQAGREDLRSGMIESATARERLEKEIRDIENSRVRKVKRNV